MLFYGRNAARYFNPLPPHGGRPPKHHRMSVYFLFQSTPSAWRETSGNFLSGFQSLHFNPLPPHGGRRIFRLADLNVEIISIHSLRMEGDMVGRGDVAGNGISIHSLRMEGDPSLGRKGQAAENFNPLPPHGGRLLAAVPCVLRYYFNPLPPHGGRLRRARCSAIHVSFQSTPSAWRETGKTWDPEMSKYILIHSLRMEGDMSGILDWMDDLVISIHSLRMEGDHSATSLHRPARDFNPLPPHGGRLVCQNFELPTNDFNPLPPHGGRPRYSLVTGRYSSFQSTPSAWRETSTDGAITLTNTDFNPLPPHGGRQITSRHFSPQNLFQSTPSAWRETATATQ